MFKYLPKQWKRQIALLFLLIAGIPFILSVAVVFVEKCWPLLLSVAVLLLGRWLLVRWRRQRLRA